jgi:hypothetical protein
MAFDDRKMEPLLVVGCFSVVCGLVAPVVGRLLGWWWSLLLFLPPVLIWVLLEWIWRHEDSGR